MKDHALEEKKQTALDNKVPVIGPQVDVIEYLVVCRKIKPKSLIRIEDCILCPFHGDYEQVAEEDPSRGRPPEFDVICNLPVRIRVEHLVKLTEGGE